MTECWASSGTTLGSVCAQRMGFEDGTAQWQYGWRLTQAASEKLRLRAFAERLPAQCEAPASKMASGPERRPAVPDAETPAAVEIRCGIRDGLRNRRWTNWIAAPIVGCDSMDRRPHLEFCTPRQLRASQVTETHKCGCSTCRDAKSATVGGIRYGRTGLPRRLSAATEWISLS